VKRVKYDRRCDYSGKTLVIFRQKSQIDNSYINWLSMDALYFESDLIID
jgi:hypothetical protein